ncbi:DUF262 domain-containing HNH endonuclease family protein [Pseudoalteromonas shioyasakiensis]|uniref:DUF262 domain-containing protein n=1 Tax=Pseudoalteromonas shioyasakiensis TaxID=1190813 RepID=UPI0021183BBB|nr:DUF262 domain-containing protein [Pseudoalteromonas shioyasakiensis]MCQ8880706.1 DUF262 domain-containing HNH endonuclease family protein [Pseudoalteromonas shioyasakiensis]
MKVNPEYKSFGELFTENNVFYTPKYQRDYSWESEQIEQFCGDINNALLALDEGKVSQHFFGGIVCAQDEGVGNRKIDNMLVDGQQRLTTIIIFFSVVKVILEKFDGDVEEREFRNALLGDIQKYLTFEERVQRERVTHQRIKIGNADNEFFQATINGAEIEKTRDSHKLIWDAKSYFETFFYETLFDGKNLSECLEIIDNIIKLFEESFLLIHIISTTVDDAYKLFMVLNDRGINLTEGELLKAHTIGNFNDDDPNVIQITNDWDLILANDARSVSDFLRWVITMLSGEHIPNTKVLDKYKQDYFTNQLSSREMAGKVRFLKEACDKLKLISDAEWPFEESTNTTQFHKTKLDWLVKKMKHTHSMPLLLAAIYTSETEFQKVISETCKFFIRYKVISNMHAGIFSSLYPETAKSIFGQRDRFSISELQGAYRNILNSKDADNEYFKAGIASLSYSRKGDNRPLKYLMVTIQENWRWLTNEPELGIRRRLGLEDKTVVFDFKNTSIEHLYPYSAKEEDRDPEMEELKNRIGNLVILNINTNASNKDKIFEDKLDGFRNSGIGVHEFILEHEQWSTVEVELLRGRYIDLCIKAFSF